MKKLKEFIDKSKTFLFITLNNPEEDRPTQKIYHSLTLIMNMGEHNKFSWICRKYKVLPPDESVEIHKYKSLHHAVKQIGEERILSICERKLNEKLRQIEQDSNRLETIFQNDAITDIEKFDRMIEVLNHGLSVLVVMYIDTQGSYISLGAYQNKCTDDCGWSCSRIIRGGCSDKEYETPEEVLAAFGGIRPIFSGVFKEYYHRREQIEMDLWVLEKIHENHRVYDEDDY